MGPRAKPEDDSFGCGLRGGYIIEKRKPCSPVGWVRARDEHLYLHKRRAPVTQQSRRNTKVLGYARDRSSNAICEE